MNCAEFEAELQRQLDFGVVSEDDRIREHCATCLVCHEAWDSALLLSDSIAVWREQIPEVDLAGAVVDVCRPTESDTERFAANAGPEIPVRRSERRRSLVVLGPVAGATSAPRRRAALVVALCLVVAIFAVKAPVGDIAAPPERSPVVIHVRTPHRPRGPETELALLNQAGAAYDTLTKSAVGALEEFASIVIPIRLSDSAVDKGEASERHWIDGLQHQWRPFRESLDEALDFLREVEDTPASSRT